VNTYKAIVKGLNVPKPGVPESFKVLIKELQSLGLDVKVLDGDKNEIDLRQSFDDDDVGLHIVDNEAFTTVNDAGDAQGYSQEGEGIFEDGDAQSEEQEDWDEEIIEPDFFSEDAGDDGYDE
ncbi:MAG: hypothetical protein IJ261_06555, partial [Clostridia bacterium]|nr:hypothetical protein [Clostridia bacterium]